MRKWKRENPVGANELLSQIVTDLLEMDETAGERLILEITETSAMTVPEVVANFMHDLQAKDITFALDDFENQRAPGNGPARDTLSTKFQFSVYTVLTESSKTTTLFLFSIQDTWNNGINFYA